MNFPLDLAVVDLTKKGRFPRENKAEIHKKADDTSPRPLFHALNLCLRGLKQEAVNSASLTETTTKKEKGEQG
jgi:hypothetical protein